jgi:LCP family protein required for cell wall assembly
MIARIRMIALILLALLGVGLLLTYLQIRDLAAQTVIRDVRRGVFSISPAAPFTMLLIGVDERPDHPEEGVRSDTIIVARIDPPGRWAALLSIPRDTLAPVRDLGQSKINAAYAHGYNNAEALYGAGTTAREGGMALAAETSGQFLGIQIDYVAQINFDGFARMVDALGGVTIDVPRQIIDDEYPTPDFGVMRVEFEPGRQHMNGERALIYARTRHADSDFGRAERQQQVVRAILDEVRARGPIGQALLLPALRAGLGNTIATTLPFDRLDSLAGMAWLGSGLSADNLVRLQIAPDTAAVQDDGGTLIWQKSDIETLVQKLLRGPTAEVARIQVFNGTTTTGLASKISSELEQQRLTIIPAGDAPRDDIPRTIVYNAHNTPRTARRVADLLHAELRDGVPDGIASEADVIVVLGADTRTR